MQGCTLRSPTLRSFTQKPQRKDEEEFDKMNMGKGVEEAFLPRCFPPWVEELVREHSGYDLRFMMEKQLEKTDCSDNHARLSIKKECLHAHILPFLKMSEKMLASLLNPLSKKKTYSNDNKEINKSKVVLGGPETNKLKMKKAVGREHGGLPVRVFTRNRWCFMLALTRWDASGATVLKGKEWKMARVLSGFRPGDEVMMWAFRRGPLKELCFVVANKEDHV